MSAISSRLFRSCTASLSTRCLFNSASPYSTRSPPSLRRFSTQTTESSQEPTSESNASASSEADSSKPNPEPEKLAAKEAEVVDLTSRLRYLQADFLNLQRNAAKEKEQTKDFAISRFAGDLLEVVDVLSLALKSVPSSALPNSTENDSTAPTASTDSPSTKSPEQYLGELHTGVEMTQRLLLQVLFKYHVKPFDPLGDVFDPNKHEALYQAPIPGKTPGTVIDVQKTGYTIKDRVLRAAQVGVAQETDS